MNGVLVRILLEWVAFSFDYLLLRDEVNFVPVRMVMLVLLLFYLRYPLVLKVTVVVPPAETQSCSSMFIIF